MKGLGVKFLFTIGAVLVGFGLSMATDNPAAGLMATAFLCLGIATWSF